MPVSSPLPCPLSASSLYSPAPSPLNRYTPPLAVRVVASTPVAALRTVTVTSSRGLEYVSVSFPDSEPTPFDCARPASAVPISIISAAIVSDFVQICAAIENQLAVVRGAKTRPHATRPAVQNRHSIPEAKTGNFPFRPIHFPCGEVASDSRACPGKIR